MAAKFRKPKEHKYIFTEKTDYSETGKESIWGTGDKETLEILQNLKIKGKWVNLAAGDGRYNLNLLKKSDFVLACDIDANALQKLQQTTPRYYKEKLDIKAFDITKTFPLDDNSFDGVFCTGVLHLFPKDVLKKIASEIDRVLKPNGKIVIDFVADAERKRLNGEIIKSKGRSTYTLIEAKKILENIFKTYKIKMYVSELVDDLQKTDPPYTLSCKFIILVADKK